MKFPFTQVAPLLDTLLKHGFAAYVVGGAVRDYLLHRPIHDIDLATSARPEEVMSLFNRTVPTGVQHGTVTVIEHGRGYEVTTFRSESGYDDFRHPNRVQFETSLEKDLMRRDFTINALAMDRAGRIIDLYGGREDMSLRRIRMVGKVEERILEDPLRIMRGIRFVAELGFSLGTAEQSSFSAHARLLEKISIERIDQEMTKLLAGPSVNEAIRLLFQTGCIYALPLLSRAAFPSGSEAVNYSLLKTDAERWTAFLLTLDITDAAPFAKAWKWSRSREQEVRFLQKYDNIRRCAAWRRTTVYRAGVDRALAVERLQTALGRLDPADLDQALEGIRQIWTDCPIHARNELAVNGKHLLNWSKARPGPWMAKALETIETHIVNGDIPNEQGAIEAWFRTWRGRQEKLY